MREERDRMRREVSIVGAEVSRRRQTMRSYFGLRLALNCEVIILSMKGAQSLSPCLKDRLSSREVDYNNCYKLM